MTTVDYPDWGTPQRNADAIAGTGAPLLTKATKLLQVSGQAIAAGTTYDPGNFSVNQPGYLLYVNAYSSQSASPNQLVITLRWFDSSFSSTVPIDIKVFTIETGTALGNHKVVIEGPCKGDTIDVQFKNPSATFTITLGEIALVADSVLRRRHVGRTINLSNIAGYSIPASDVNAGILCSTAPNVAHNASSIVILPLYNGNVTFKFSTSSGTTDGQLKITSDDPNVATDQVFYNATTPSTGLINATIGLPSAQCFATLLNNNATNSETLTLVMVSNEQVTG